MTHTPARDETRDAYRLLVSIPTRWMDNDVYGHVNNVIYYSYFDTAVNKWLIDQGMLDFRNGKTIGLVVATSCSYYRSIAFPDLIEAGLRVVHLGTSSVRYEIGLFRAGDPALCAAGAFTHVYVDRDSNRPTPMSTEMRAALTSISTI
jgi:acyl-CoA thioester hydrolase